MKNLMRTVCAAALLTASCGGEQTDSENQRDVRSGELSSSCAGVMPPAAPRNWTLAQTVGDEGGCGIDTSDVNGDVAIGRTFGPGSSQEWETDSWQLFSGAGAARGAIVQNNQALILPQSSGFQTLGDQNGCGFDPNCQPDYGLRSWSATGKLTGHGTPSFAVWHAEIDPSAGVLLAGVVSRPTSYQIVAQRFDRLSAPRSAPAVVATGSASPILVVGTVNVAEHSLILWNGDFSGFPQGSLVGRWLDRTGHPLTNTFVVARNVLFQGTPSGGVSATLLLDDTVAVRAFAVPPVGQPAHQAWLARVTNVSKTVTSVPTWLASRPDARVFIVRGGRAYALLFPIDPSTCGPVHMALFAPSGVRCGGLDFDSGSPGPTCALASNIGRDGTLFVGGSSDPNAASCKDRVFPGLLR